MLILYHKVIKTDCAYNLVVLPCYRSVTW